MTKRSEPEERDAARDAALSAAAIGALMSLAALGIYGGRTAMSVGVGALIAVANLVMLSAIIRAIIRPPEEQGGADADPTDPAAAESATDDTTPPRDHKAEGKRGGTAWGVFGLFKILLLFGGIWILLTRGLVDPIPLVVGYGVLPLGIVASGLLANLRPRP